MFAASSSLLSSTLSSGLPVSPPVGAAACVVDASAADIVTRQIARSSGVLPAAMAATNQRG